MWQRPNSYYRYELEDGLASMVANVMVMSLLLAYLLSVIVTRLILHYFVNPLLDDRLSEDDQLLLLMSGLIWIGLGQVVVLPTLLADSQSQGQDSELLMSLAGSVLGFGGWGLLVGFGVLIWLYWEIGATRRWEPTHGFESITGLPGEHYLPAEPDQPAEPELTLDDVTAMLWDDDLEMSPAAKEDLFKPVEAVPASAKNGRE
jgi:hypothetical protein